MTPVTLAPMTPLFVTGPMPEPVLLIVPVMLFVPEIVIPPPPVALFAFSVRSPVPVTSHETVVRTFVLKELMVVPPRFTVIPPLTVSAE